MRRQVCLLFAVALAARLPLPPRHTRLRLARHRALQGRCRDLARLGRGNRTRTPLRARAPAAPARHGLPGGLAGLGVSVRHRLAQASLVRARRRRGRALRRRRATELRRSRSLDLRAARRLLHRPPRALDLAQQRNTVPRAGGRELPFPSRASHLATRRTLRAVGGAPCARLPDPCRAPGALSPARRLDRSAALAR